MDMGRKTLKMGMNMMATILTINFRERECISGNLGPFILGSLSMGGGRGKESGRLIRMGLGIIMRVITFRI